MVKKIDDEAESFSPEQHERIRQVQTRLPEQERQRGKKVSGGKVDRRVMRDRS